MGKKSDSLGVKEELYWDVVQVDNFICPILHNQINLGINIFHNLLDYGNEYIEIISVDENKVRNSLLLIISSINDKINSRKEFDVSDEEKEPNNLTNLGRNDQTSITNMIDEILNRDYRIDELNKKREVFSNNISKIKRYNFKLKEILNDGRRFKNRTEFGIEDKIYPLLQIYYIKQEAWFGGTK